MDAKNARRADRPRMGFGRSHGCQKGRHLLILLMMDCQYPCRSRWSSVMRLVNWAWSCALSSSLAPSDLGGGFPLEDFSSRFGRTRFASMSRLVRFPRDGPRLAILGVVRR